jgi:hypothetical protein
MGSFLADLDVRSGCPLQCTSYRSLPLLRDMLSYGFRLPADRQTRLRSRVVILGANALDCIDIDHQGKAMRYLYVKGAMLAVFPCFGCPGREWAVDVNVLRNRGAPESLLRSTAERDG